MADSFDPCLAFTLQEEGGFADAKDDPGGPTMHGLTMADLTHWDRDATPATLRAMPPDLVAALYRALYWMPVRGWALWSGLDLMLFDAAVNTGVGTAVKQVQRLLLVQIDGDMGPVTATAARASQYSPALLLALHKAQSDAYRGMAGFPRFGAGWLSRCDRRYFAAVHLAQPQGATA